jgi:hypothetical protein
MTVDIEIKQLAETQARLKRLLEDVSARGGLRGAFAKATLRALRYVIAITHVLSGRLKNSHFPRVGVQGNQVYGSVSTNVAYASIEHARGGSHAFYERTVKEEGDAIRGDVEAYVDDAVRRANG